MGRIASSTPLSLQYSPRTEVSVTTDEVFNRIGEILEGTAGADDAALVQLSSLDSKELDASAAERALLQTTPQDDGIKFLDNLVLAQQSIVAKLSQGFISNDQSRALKTEFNALVSEYNRVYSELTANEPQDPLVLSASSSIDLDSSLTSGISYSNVSISTSNLSADAGTGTTSELVENILPTDTALDPGTGIDATFTANLGSLGSTVTLDAGTPSPIVSEDGITPTISYNYYLNYNPTVTAITASSATDIFSGDFTSLTTGQKVLLTDSGGLPEGLDPNQNYYLIKIDNSQAQLAASYADAMSSTAIDLSVDVTQGAFTTYSTESAVDFVSDSFNITSHGYTTGDVVYLENPGGETAPGGLQASKAYYVIAVDADNFKLALTESDALSNTNIDITDGGSSSTGNQVTIEKLDVSLSNYDLTANTFTSGGHGLSTGDRVLLDAESFIAEGLSETEYYVIAVDSDTIKFASSYDNAINDIEVDITNYGYGDLTITELNDFEASSNLIYSGAHNYTDGDRIRFSGAGLPPEITAGQDYYVIASDPDSFKIATSYSDALLNTAVNFSTNGSGSINVTEINSDVYLPTSEITVASHGLSTGNRVRVSTSGTLPAELSAATDYYVISTGANTIQLAATLGDAMSGTEILFSTEGFGTLDITSYSDGDYNSLSNEIYLAGHGLTAGERIQFTGSGTAPAGLSKSTDYYAIVTGDPDVFKVASSYANAIAEIEIDFTDTGSGSINLTTFDAESAFNSTNDTIFQAAHGYSTGDRIQFTNTSGNLPTGLDTGKDYYVISVDADTYRISETLAGSGINDFIDFSGAASGTSYSTSLSASVFNPTSDSVTITGHGLSTGQRVRLSDSGSDYSYLPEGLSGQDYYAIKVDNNTLKFAYSEELAAAGTAVDFSGYGSFTVTLQAFSESSTTVTGGQGTFDLDSDLGLLSAAETLSSLSNSLSSLRAASSALNARLKGISAYSAEENKKTTPTF